MRVHWQAMPKPEVVNRLLPPEWGLRLEGTTVHGMPKTTVMVLATVVEVQNFILSKVLNGELPHNDAVQLTLFTILLQQTGIEKLRGRLR